MSKNTPTTSAIEPVKVVAAILQEQMALTDRQISLSYQDYSIPDNGLFVVLGYIGPTETIANQSYFDATNDQEVQEVSVRHTIQIELMSMAPDNSARIRKEEVLLALRSFHSQREQGKNLLGIAWLQSDFVDASAQEGTTMLNRYITTCAVNALHRRVIAADSFVNFPVELTVESQDGRGKTVEINPTILPTAL